MFFRRGKGIFVLDTVTRRVERLTTGATDSARGWSPDGREITFTRGDAVYVMNPDGTGAERVLENASGSGCWACRRSP